MNIDKTEHQPPKYYFEQKNEKPCNENNCPICQLLIGKIPLSAQNFPASPIGNTPGTASEVVNTTNVFYLDLTENLL